MKPLGKAMKMAHSGNKPEHTALTQLLSNYRDTPHPATGLPPAAMLFRDPPNSAFPRVLVDDQQVKDARKRDWEAKVERQLEVNNSKYKKRSEFETGDWVLIRNFTKRSKFDPHFQPEPCRVTEVSGGWVALERAGTRYRRHLDDIKALPDYQPVSHPPSNMQDGQQMQWTFPFDGDGDEYAACDSPLLQDTTQDETAAQEILRRSARLQQRQRESPASGGLPSESAQTMQQDGQREESPARGGQPQSDVRALHKQRQRQETLAHGEAGEQMRRGQVHFAEQSDGAPADTGGSLQGVQQHEQLQDSSSAAGYAGNVPATVAQQQQQRAGSRKVIHTQQLLRNLSGGRR